MTAEFEKLLTSGEYGYTDVREVPNKGVCGIRKMLFTYGLFYGMDEYTYTYKGRYCYESYEEAQIALKYWDGQGDPLGNILAHK